MYLEVSTPPRVNSPLVSLVSLPDSGLNETPSTSDEMEPWMKRLCRKVGTELVPETVPEVRLTGPTPKMPSTSLKPVAVDAAPID